MQRFRPVVVALVLVTVVALLVVAGVSLYTFARDMKGRFFSESGQERSLFENVVFIEFPGGYDFVEVHADKLGFTRDDWGRDIPFKEVRDKLPRGSMCLDPEQAQELVAHFDGLSSYWVRQTRIGMDKGVEAILEGEVREVPTDYFLLTDLCYLAQAYQQDLISYNEMTSLIGEARRAIEQYPHTTPTDLAVLVWAENTFCLGETPVQGCR